MAKCFKCAPFATLVFHSLSNGVHCVMGKRLASGASLVDRHQCAATHARVWCARVNADGWQSDTGRRLSLFAWCVVAAIWACAEPGVGEARGWPGEHRIPRAAHGTNGAQSVCDCCGPEIVAQGWVSLSLNAHQQYVGYCIILSALSLSLSARIDSRPSALHRTHFWHIFLSPTIAFWGLSDVGQSGDSWEHPLAFFSLKLRASKFFHRGSVCRGWAEGPSLRLILFGCAASLESQSLIVLQKPSDFNPWDIFP